MRNVNLDICVEKVSLINLQLCFGARWENIDCKCPWMESSLENNLELWNCGRNQRAGQTLGPSMQRAAHHAKKTVIKEGRSERKREKLKDSE